jgi:serine/threonine protein kinase/tetratricopeptide (TPR) repeat protein
MRWDKVAPVESTSPATVGGSRFEVRRRLGAGGFGIVYEAYDQERRTEVAIKTLTRLDAAALYRFKREFRALADVRHPNLVELHELVSIGEDWLLVMELVRGTDALSWVRGVRHTAPDAVTIDAPAAPPVPVAPLTPAAQKARIRLGDQPTIIVSIDYGRLRDVLVQLADAVIALHAAGKLHRDLKPSNVLVEEASGRVVVVDFGIATELHGHVARQSDAGMLAGTPEYMAPEQATGDPLSEAADWYAFGVLLFEALTGRLPFVGAPIQVLIDKQRFEAPRPSELTPSVPKDLATLCCDLLRIRADARPTGPEVLRRLGAPSVANQRVHSGMRSAIPSHPSGPTALVGRARELSVLRNAYEATRLGRAATVVVTGRSGMGKTALVRAFLDEISSGAVVLAGRCYERESVPYKALDAVVDELSRELLKLPPAEAAVVVPRDAAALVRLFPVLQRVAAIADAPRRRDGTAEPQLLRRRAFAALRELLTRLADRRPVVVFIDDLHWGDADSAALLAELVAPPDPPPLLLVVGHAEEDLGANTVLTPLRATPALAGDGGVQRIRLGPLSKAEVIDLASALLGAEAAAPIADGLLEESSGIPLLVREVLDGISAQADVKPTDFRLDAMLHARLEALPASGRRLVRVLAVAGRPMRIDRAMRAAELSGEDRREALDCVRVARLVRAAGTRGSDTAEPWHERVRAAVLRELDDAALRTTHGAIANALRELGDEDPEALFTHFHAAGNDALATRYAEQAAAKAMHALAFDRAAEFFRQALDLAGEDQERELTMWEQLGTALAHAGRGAEASEALLTASEGATGLPRLELRRRAAEQLLVSGRVEEGLRVMRAVLQPLGLELAATPFRALLALLVLRAWIAIRGLGFVEHDPATVPPRTLARIDVAWSTAAGLAVVDNVRAAHFQTRNLLMCLRAGEPMRLLRALVLETIFVATRGVRRYARALEIIETCRALARRLRGIEAEALVELGVASAAYFTGHWRLAGEAVDRFLALDRGGPSRLHWELRSIQYFGLCARIYRGELEQLAQRLPIYLRDAHDRGDLYFGTNLYVGETNLWWLLADDPLEARRVIEAAMANWSRDTVQVQHWYALQSLAHIDLYTGSVEGTLARVERALPGIRASQLLRVQHTRVRARWLRARCALAGVADRASLAKAEADARAMEREHAPWAAALAGLVRAGVAGRRGDRTAARDRLARAVDDLDAADMPLLATLARLRLGALDEGEEPARAVADATSWLLARGVRAPPKLARVYLPGFDAPVSATDR